MFLFLFFFLLFANYSNDQSFPPNLFGNLQLHTSDYAKFLRESGHNCEKKREALGTRKTLGISNVLCRWAPGPTPLNEKCAQGTSGSIPSKQSVTVPSFSLNMASRRVSSRDMTGFSTDEYNGTLSSGYIV